MEPCLSECAHHRPDLEAGDRSIRFLPVSSVTMPLIQSAPSIQPLLWLPGGLLAAALAVCRWLPRTPIQLSSLTAASGCFPARPAAFSPAPCSRPMAPPAPTQAVLMVQFGRFKKSTSGFQLGLSVRCRLQQRSERLWLHVLWPLPVLSPSASRSSGFVSLPLSPFRPLPYFPSPFCPGF